MIALILRFIKPIEMMKLKTWPKGQGFQRMNNPDAGLFEMFSPSTLFRRGAPGQGADAVSTEIRGGAAAVKERAILYPPITTINEA